MLQQPLRRARIEIVHALPVEGMPGVVVKVEVGAGDVGGGFFAHPARSKGIILACDDEHGALDVLQVVERVVADGGGALRFHRVDGLGRGIDCGVLQALLHVVPAVVVVEPRLGEDEHLHVVHEVLRAHRGLAVHKMLRM